MKPLAWKTVVVVDDSPLVRERLIALLSEAPGVQVVGAAANAPEAIDLIPRLNPAVVVLDISMPGGSGLQVLESLRGTPKPPMRIVLTNFAQEHYRKRCLELGADYFFDKSTEFEEVKALLENLSKANRSVRAMGRWSRGGSREGKLEPAAPPRPKSLRKSRSLP
jgi:DNA-binding NarL/FixJ family response regulator